MKKLWLWTCLVYFLSGIPGFAEEIREIHWATPEWKNYTNRDKGGLYNEIVKAIFEVNQITVHREYVPWKRALLMVKLGKADMTGGDEPNDIYLYSTYPIIQSEEMVFFKKRSIPSWNGIESLLGKRGVWYRGYTESFPKEVKQNLQGRGVNARSQAVKIVAYERGADYYFDNYHQMMLTLGSTDIALDADEYQIERIYNSQLYMLFRDSTRGQIIRDIFDRGIERLYCLGKLQTIFEKWNRPVPDYTIHCHGSQ